MLLVNYFNQNSPSDNTERERTHKMRVKGNLATHYSAFYTATDDNDFVLIAANFTPCYYDNKGVMARDTYLF